jgi:hypothetical protein
MSFHPAQLLEQSHTSNKIRLGKQRQDVCGQVGTKTHNMARNMRERDKKKERRQIDGKKE